MRALVVAAVMAMMVTACGGGGNGGVATSESPRPSGAQADDPELLLGRDVFVAECARCHGDRGEGGTGPRLAEGRAEQRYPNIEDQVSLVVEGKNLMPSFRGDLSMAEIRAVVRYERDVL